jgi:hypothetical protein
MSDYYNNVIHKIDRRGKMLVVKDMTNDEWDISDYNNYKFEFVEYDTNSNKAVKRFPFFVDADEINAYLSTILTGAYSKIVGWHTFFAGSANSGQAEKLVDGNMKKVISGPESRKLTIGVNDSGYFVLKIEIANGKVGRRGEVTPNGDTVDSISFGIKAEEAVVLAKTIESYTTAKKSLGIRYYTQNKKKHIKEAG